MEAFRTVADKQAYLSALGETIHSIKLNSETDNYLLIKFKNRKGIKIWDDGQFCCEARYMVCDDDFSHFVGAKLLDLTILKVDSAEENGGFHEVQFLRIDTDKGSIRISNHNEHNGYYGGFLLAIAEV